MAALLFTLQRRCLERVLAFEHPLLANEKAVMLQVFSIVTRKDERDVYELYFLLN